MTQPAGQHRSAQYQQDIADNGTGDRRLHHVMQSGPQGSERNDQLGRITEGRVQEPSDSFAHVFGKLFGSAPHNTGKRQDGKTGGSENQQVPLWSEVLQSDGGRDKEEEPIHRTSS